MKVFDLVTRARNKFFRRLFIQNYTKDCGEVIGKALLYYKTDSLVFKSVANNPSHVNHWEVIEIVRILNRLGYSVDILDRTVEKSFIEKNIKDEYKVFIGIGAGDSGKYYADIAERVSSAVRIFYALGPEPDKSNELIYKRYDYFHQRHPDAKVEVRRTINHVDVQRAMDSTEIIFCCGSDFAQQTFTQFQKKIYKIPPSSSPEIQFHTSSFRRRSPKKFLYFGGNGNIVKGLDIVIEAFAKTPDNELYICAPQEEDFNQVYKKTLEENKNIHYLGFIRIGGKEFYDLTSECGYIIFASCSEGGATSVTTCMRAGLVPIVTKESGIDIAKECGVEMENITVENVRKHVQQQSDISQEELVEKSIHTYNKSNIYTQGNFSHQFELSLIDVIFIKI